MRKFILGALALLPFAAMAQDGNCQHSQARDLKLDLAGAKAVVFDIGQHDIEVVTGTDYAVHGRACASDAKYLPELTLSQHRVGDKLVVVARRDQRAWLSLGNNYAYLRLKATVPADLMVQLNVGSGDARATGVAALSADVGSGDVRAENVRGQVTADVGSGDIELENIGALHVVSVGSGDLKARKVARDVKVGDIGSGDVELYGVGGNVEVDEIGSGDIEVHGARGNLHVRSVGSGSVRHRDVTGKVDVPRDNE